jgi:hypothetical protein
MNTGVTLDGTGAGTGTGAGGAGTGAGAGGAGAGGAGTGAGGGSTIAATGIPVSCEKQYNSTTVQQVCVLMRLAVNSQSRVQRCVFVSSL